MAHISKVNDIGLTVGIALRDSGWHPGSLHEAEGAPAALTDPAYWRALVQLAARGGADYVTVADALGQVDQSAPRLDALLLSSWIAPLVSDISIIPEVTTTHTEPFHVATGLQTLDHISSGRAGWQVTVSRSDWEAHAFGRATAVDNELFAEASEAVEVARRLWDSWEADAVIKDVATGRFLDRDRVHHINYVGERFSVVGPSIVPRSPQGQLPIAVTVRSDLELHFAARSADIVFIPARGGDTAASVADVRSAENGVDRAERGLSPLRVIADVAVALDLDGETAAERVARLDRATAEPWTSDVGLILGGATQVADAIHALHAQGVDGVRLRPLTQPGDVRAIAQDLLPELRARGVLPSRPVRGTLRETFALGAATNRYETSQEFAA